MKAILSASLITAIKTPYLPDGTIDLVSYDRLLEYQISNGVEGVIVGGTTGEGHLMNWEEHLMLIAHTVHRYADRLLVFGNTGSNNTREAIKATEFGFASGMHAALQINPYYGKTSDAGLQEHFQRLLDIGPAIIYNVAGRTAQDLQPELIEDLAQHTNFLGMKECSGNNRIGYYESKGIPCWSGNDDQCFEGRHQHSSHGVISVTSNVVPGLMRKLMDENDSQLNERLHPLISWLFTEPNPIGLNTALSMLGAIQPVFRLPYCPLGLSSRQQGLELLREFSDSERVGNTLNLLQDNDFILSA